ncbi:hypothetical protein HOLleu_40889 [Holothuria leucospilota]|uniref:Uncharacterized protein n=1 Tax=Holothuria leucospilota TaxID=206669 RepID=A0A9Q0YEU9_HOLLE|nr:hypothetical protein HOLleu_40889 [Holothuria leucospilota]
MRPPVQRTSVHNKDFEGSDSRQEINNSLAGSKQNEDVFCGISYLAKLPSFVLLLFIHCIICYNFVSWAIFLVPYGVSLGFRPDVVVFLSTAGGIGGFWGKVSLLAVFYCDVGNTLVLFVVPAFTFTVGLIGYIFTTNYFLLLASSIISGFSIAFAEGAASAVLPHFICRCHLRQGIAFSYLCTGIFFQTSGILSGEYCTSSNI